MVSDSKDRGGLPIENHFDPIQNQREAAETKEVGRNDATEAGRDAGAEDGGNAAGDETGLIAGRIDDVVDAEDRTG